VRFIHLIEVKIDCDAAQVAAGHQEAPNVHELPALSVLHTPLVSIAIDKRLFHGRCVPRDGRGEVSGAHHLQSLSSEANVASIPTR
jgi:hypothetical protein